MKQDTQPISRKEMDHILQQKSCQLKMIRLFDILASGGGLILISPILLVVSLLIKADSKGPVFFRQVRVGKNGRKFQIMKFRSMTHTPKQTGPLLTSKDDQRVTKVGAVIRKFKLDELPQLFNVLKGDMGLVGPRPEVQKYVDHYSEEAKQVLRIRPGITDLASIEYYDESSLLDQAQDVDQVYIDVIMPAKHALNYKYIRHMSLGYNLKIIFRTIFRVLR